MFANVSPGKEKYPHRRLENHFSTASTRLKTIITSTGVAAAMIT